MPLCQVRVRSTLPLTKRQTSAREALTVDDIRELHRKIHSSLHTILAQMSAAGDFRGALYLPPWWGRPRFDKAYWAFGGQRSPRYVALCLVGYVSPEGQWQMPQQTYPFFSCLVLWSGR